MCKNGTPILYSGKFLWSENFVVGVPACITYIFHGFQFRGCVGTQKFRTLESFCTVLATPLSQAHFPTSARKLSDACGKRHTSYA